MDGITVTENHQNGPGWAFRLRKELMTAKELKERFPCTVDRVDEEPRIICPHCHKATTPRIVEDAAIYWERARVVEGEKVIACCDEIYRVYDEESVNTRLQCTECWQEFAPPEDYTVEWR